MSNLTVYAKEVVSCVDMREAITLYGIEANAHGYASCPFHNEKTPSMKVWRDHFKCFGCGASGDIISFVQKLCGLEFVDTLKRINEDFSLNLPIGERVTLRQSREYSRKSAALEEARRQEQQNREDAETEYFQLLDEYIRLQRNYDTYKPNAGADELHPLFVEACHRLELASNKLDSFDLKRRR